MPGAKPVVPSISDAEEERIQAGIAADPDNPEWTEADFRQARPFAEIFPDLAANLKRLPGRPRLERPKKQITLRLDQDVIEKFKAGGPGWQGRINDALRKASGG